MQDLAYCAVFAALIIVFAFVSIPVGAAGVPIVLQNAIVILAGLILGPKRGLLATALFLAIGLLGIPVLAGGRSTLSAMAGPTIGYMVGYLFAAFVAGAIAYRAGKGASAVITLAIAALSGLAIQYILGSVGLMLRADMAFGPALAVNGPFIIPDLIKMAAAVAIASGVHKAFPDLRKRA
ncbi:biotin transporter BioY [Corynebacterium pseudopelargi]|uniref:Biotin transporter n=1 Tax=Corynebacterium pseudopelargi TaxID=2080757 RepID=A0A3G6IS71_9CORY|nr:biotin transporter BioY [Corynebacterium pseudopelargi]AZA08475.1 Biotin transporter BioY [Corynebacterium pseudopelargi]